VKVGNNSKGITKARREQPAVQRPNWDGFGGKGSELHPHQLAGERYKLPSGVRGQVAAAQQFSYILSTMDGFPASICNNLCM